MGSEEEIIRKYKEKIAKELNDVPLENTAKKSEQYGKFKAQFMPTPLTYYEKGCQFAGNLFKIQPSPKESADLREAIRISHLDTTPGGVLALSFLLPLILIVVGSLVAFAVFNKMGFVLYFIIIGAMLMFLLRKMPFFIANSWRLKASNQMVQSVFYVVTYMRHTSNFENALQFASEHLSPPLSLDFKKVLWDVETNKYDTVKGSLDAYLETWRKWNMEFIEAFHLIESSLFEPSEDRRVSLLEKALDVILNETYEKMLHYTHDLKSPITVLHMLGIILPILGLVILPMVTSFMTSEDMTPNTVALYLAVLYNVTLPIIVYIMGRIILTKRPTGYGESDITDEFPGYKKYKNIIIKLGNKELSIDPFYMALAVGGILCLIGFYPLIHGAITDRAVLMAEEPFFMNFKVFGYKMDISNKNMIGPYGVGAALLSLCVTLGLGIGVGLYYKFKSQNIIKIREETKKLEREFASGLFQLGNRIGDGIPTEIAFQNVAKVMQGTRTGKFFTTVATNISDLGMSIKQAIFDNKVGALVEYPSNVIRSSMRVLMESSKKGPQVASRTLLTVAEYIKEIHRVNERLLDLMAEIISSMKSQISFMAPVISGIVIGITSMIVNILGQLRTSIASLDATTPLGSGGAGILTMFGDGVPAYFFQIVVGLYVVEIVWVMTILVNGIESGSDKLSENYLKGQNLIKSTTLYCMITFVVIIMFNFIASTILSSSNLV